MKKISAIVGAVVMTCAVGSVHGADVITHRNIGMDLARDIANEAVKACRKDGYHVAAVVVDRHGNLRAALRDDIASVYMLQIAQEKANLVIMAGIPSAEFRNERSDIRPELNHLDGIIVMGGGLPIDAGGSRIGAVAVAGAPGADKDEVCAAKALEAMIERLEFAE